jgi:hypothetical protein
MSPRRGLSKKLENPFPLEKFSAGIERIGALECAY